MAQDGVRQVVGKLIADRNFQKSFKADPHEALKDSGYHLSATEITALSKLKASDFHVGIGQRAGAAVESYEVDVRSAKV